MKNQPEKQQIFRNAPAGRTGLRAAERVSAALAAALLAVTVFVCARRGDGAAPFSLEAEAASAADAAADGRLDLNAAGADVLEDLPGIGPVLAARIVAWREEHGSFTCPEDVMAVEGIGPGIWAGIEPYVTF